MMNKTLVICAVVFSLWYPALSSAGSPAGMVLYMTTESEVYLLLADHSGVSRRGWSSYGGGAKGDETPVQTAARETEEETRGYFHGEELLKALEGKQAVFDGYFYLFFHEISFVPSQRVENNRLENNALSLKERGPYAWIPWSEVKKYLSPAPGKGKYVIDGRFLPKNAKRNWFWDTWIENMREAYRQNRIPWDRREDTHPVE